MNDYITILKDFAITRKKVIFVGAIGALLLGTLTGLYIYNNPTKTSYQAIKACDLFIPTEAQDLLGNDKVISLNTTDPVVSGDTAVSKCSYTDDNEDKDKMRVAAFAIRSAINDDGALQNAKDFETNKSNNTIEEVAGLGDKAFFNKTAGQLNILKGRDWLILSIGAGSTPEANTLDDAKKLAERVL